MIFWQKYWHYYMDYKKYL